MSLGLWKISDWIKYHRVVKINQVSDLRLEAAQGNKIDFTGFVQNVELCYKKVYLLKMVFLASPVSLSALNLMDWQLYDLQIHLPGSRSMTPLPARFRTLNTVGSELVRMKK